MLAAVAPGRRLRGPVLADRGPVPVAVAPARVWPLLRPAGSGAVPRDAWSLVQTTDRCAVSRHAMRGGAERVRREKEIKFTLGLLTGVQCAENVGTKFTQQMRRFIKSLLTVRSEAEKVYTTRQNNEK